MSRREPGGRFVPPRGGSGEGESASDSAVADPNWLATTPRSITGPFGRIIGTWPSGRIPPLVDQIVPCAAGEVAPDGRVRLVEPLNVLALPADADGRLVLPELSVYVQMADDGAHGTYDLSVEIRGTPDAPLPHAQVEPLRATFEKRDDVPTRSFGHVFRVCDLRFDGPGVYFVFALCGRGVMDGGPSYPTRPAKLRVARAGETPG